MSTIYYTPNGIAKQPGYNDPYNPYATGRAGESNSELNGGQNNTESGWNYDTGSPYPGAVQQSNGEWVMPGGGGGGGYGGGGDLTASPYYQQYQSQIQAAQAADLANTKSQLQQLLIQFGLVPEGFQDKYGALDDTIRQLIQKNTDTGISGYARLLQAKGDAQRTAIQNLAKRGLSRSGAKGYALRQGTLDWNRQFSDALNSVLGSANTLQGGYAGREMDRQSGLSQFLAQLAANFRFPTYSGGGGGGYVPQAPQVPQVDPQQYWNSNPEPTYTNPATGTNFYGGFGGLESTKFPGKTGY